VLDVVLEQKDLKQKFFENALIGAVLSTCYKKAGFRTILADNPFDKFHELPEKAFHL